MAKWEIEYYDEGNSAWIPINGEIDQINEDETDENASFFIANTPANRSLIQMDAMVNFWFDNKLQFAGILSGGDISGGKIKAICYDPIALILDQFDTFTKVYDQKAANAILTDLLLGTGLTIDGTAPTTPISVVFYNANRLDVLKFIASTCGTEYWSDDGVTVKFGARGGSTWYSTTMKLSKRGIDRSKQVDCVRVRGIEATTGYHIVGVAGSPGGRTKVLDETTPTDINGLNTIAAKKLAELQTDSSGAPITVLMTAAATSDNEGADLGYGDYVHLENPKYLLNGNYRILQITKGKIKASFQVDKVRRSLDKEIADLKSWENKGIYLPGSTSWSLNLQGLLVLLHLNEGEGTTAKNCAPVDEPIDGTITEPYWQEGPITKLLTLNGSSSMISLGSASQAGINLTVKLSVGAWFSPSANDSTTRNVCHKDGQFALYYKVSTGILSFDLVIGGVVHIFNSDAGLVTVGGRIFAMVTYDGSHVCMYYNGQLHKQWNQSGSPSTSANTVYIGVFLKGALSEVMLWSRALISQEVLELYFFPLLRVVSKAGGGGSASKGWYCTIITPLGGTTSPSGYTHVETGGTLEVTATPANVRNWAFDYWIFDGTRVYGSPNPLVIDPQDELSYHTLTAVFLQIGSELRGEVININDGEFDVEEKFHLADSILLGSSPQRLDDAKWTAQAMCEDEQLSRAEGIQPIASNKFGNSDTSANSTSCINTIIGSTFTSPSNPKKILNIVAYVLISTTAKNMKVAIYAHSDLSLIVESVQKTVPANASPQRVVFQLTNADFVMNGSTDYLFVIWCSSASGSGNIYYTSGLQDQSHTRALTYGSFPNPLGAITHSNVSYCLEINYCDI